jgi:thermostable 8-oxoguanine DNA glycosylase
MSWGRYTEPFTPAFWRAYFWIHEDQSSRPVFKVGHRNICDEVALCVLGGFGIKAEAAYAYYGALKTAGLLKGGTRPTIDSIRDVLRRPAEYHGRSYRYRFPNQKAKYLAAALAALATEAMPTDDLELRDWLMQIQGIGWKTAGWIVRNCYGSDNVAIIDIHLQRAGRLMKLFDSRLLSDSTYGYFEQRFLEFARALDVRASFLDLFMWETMRGSALPL